MRALGREGDVVCQWIEEGAVGCAVGEYPAYEAD